MPSDFAAKLEPVQKDMAEKLVLRCELNVEQIQELANALKDNATLTELNLGTACIGDEGMRALAALWDKAANERARDKAKAGDTDMRSEKEKEKEREKEKAERERIVMSQLMTLELHRNLIGVAGAEALARALSFGALPNLKLLFLSNNDIGDAGLAHLADALIPVAQPVPGAASRCALAHLQVFDLYGNKIGTDGVVALANACKDGGLPGLQKLHLDLRGVTEDAQELMKDSLHETSGAQVFFG